MRYLDEDYDGLIVKLPNWFIKLNGLETLIDNFKKDIEQKSEFSILFGDYMNSLYELEIIKPKRNLLLKN